MPTLNLVGKLLKAVLALGTGMSPMTAQPAHLHSLLKKLRLKNLKQAAKLEPGLRATKVLHRSQRDVWYLGAQEGKVQLGGKRLPWRAEADP